MVAALDTGCVGMCTVEPARRGLVVSMQIQRGRLDIEALGRSLEA